MTTPLAAQERSTVERFTEVLATASQFGITSFTVMAGLTLRLSADSSEPSLDMGIFTPGELFSIARHSRIDGLLVQDGKQVGMKVVEARYRVTLADGSLQVNQYEGTAPERVTCEVAPIVLELIEETKALNFGTLILSHHMSEGDVAHYYKNGTIFRQLLAADLQSWTDFFELNRKTPQLDGVRSEMLTRSDGPRVMIRLTATGAKQNDTDDARTINLGDLKPVSLDPSQFVAAAPLSTPMNNHADPRAMGLSDPEYCALLPKQRRSYEASGLALFLPYIGITVVPYEMGHGGGWYAVVAEDSDAGKRGGHILWISKTQIETGIERALSPVNRTILEEN